VLDELAAEAPDRWPAPWCDAVLDVIHRGAVIGTPVAEYLPDRLVAGRPAPRRQGHVVKRSWVGTWVVARGRG
jgi:hypothetical protein